ncbi:MAG: hypothetical protein WC095_00350 [Candidatus Paceibacterota bacterium]
MRKTFITSGIIILLLGIASFLLILNKQNKNIKPDISSGIIKPTGEDPSLESGLRCYKNDHYLAVVSQDASGRDKEVSVFVRSELIEPVQCAKYIKINKFTLDLEPATFVFGLIGKYLVLDIGTGPSNRKLQVYNIETKVKVYEDMYAELKLVEPDTLVYWSISNTPATKTNCREYTEIKVQDFTPQLQKITQYSLTTKKLTSGETRCVSTQ